MADHMTDDEARQFAEATFLDVLRGDTGDFRMTIIREGGRYVIDYAIPDEVPGPTMEGDTFAEAWLSAHREGTRRGKFGVIQGGKD